MRAPYESAEAVLALARAELPTMDPLDLTAVLAIALGQALADLCWPQTNLQIDLAQVGMLIGAGAQQRQERLASEVAGCAGRA